MDGAQLPQGYNQSHHEEKGYLKRVMLQVVFEEFEVD